MNSLLVVVVVVVHAHGHIHVAVTVSAAASSRWIRSWATYCELNVDKSSKKMEKNWDLLRNMRRNWFVKP